MTKKILYATSQSKRATIFRAILITLLLLSFFLIPYNIRLFAVIEVTALFFLIFQRTFTITVYSDKFGISRNRIFGLFSQSEYYSYCNLHSVEALEGGVDPYHGIIPYVVPSKEYNVIRIMLKGGEDKMEIYRTNIDYKELCKCVHLINKELIG